MTRRVSVLFTGNSARSQILHSFLEQDPQLTVTSAGVAPKAIRPQEVATIAEVGIDISRHTSDHIAW